MNEKQKMINGYLYDATDKNLDIDRINAQNLYFEINNLSPTQDKKRKELFKKLLGKTTDNFYIRGNFYCDYGYNIEIGDNFYANHNLTILDCAKVKFGNNVLIAPNCSFYTATHPIDVEERLSWQEVAFPITIEDNVWIGGNVCVLPDVTIGKNSIIGAGSVVNKNIPQNVIAAGNPCKVIRKITAKDRGKYRKYAP